MKRISFIIISSLFSVLILSLFTACNPDKIKPGEKGSIKLEFDNMVGESDFVLNTGTYTNASSEQFSVTKLSYYISNIKLKNADGKEFVAPQSYHLVREEVASSQLITLNDIPADDYTEISFTIGVDSLRNTMNASERTGDLDVGGVGADMYWMWNSGYIFFKMEGTSPAVPLDSVTNQRNFYYHIGGFGGYSSPTINNIKTTSLSFMGEKATVRDDKTPEVHIGADLLKVFTGVKNIKLADNPTIMFNPTSVDIANNYQSMFEVHHVHNEH